jgi:hypothetical protein
MDSITKNAITYIVTVAVGPVAADLAWSIYKGSMPDGSPVPVVFPLKAAASTSSSAAMMVVERNS